MSNLRESKQLIAVLKRCLKMKGITYKQLSEQLHLSESSVKRLFAANSLSMQRFEQICEVLSMSIYDVVLMAKEEFSDIDKNMLSIEQEEILASDAKFLIGFHLLLNGWSLVQIQNALAWSKAQTIKVLTSLDKLGLINLLPDNKVKLLTPSSIRWRKDGAIRKKYEKHVFSEFLSAEFSKNDEFLDFELLELSSASRKILKRKLDLLLKEINELATIDQSLKQSQKESIGIILGLRPWAFSVAIDAMTDSYLNNRAGFHREYQK